MWQNNSIRSTACRSISIACRRIFVELFLHVFINIEKKNVQQRRTKQKNTLKTTWYCNFSVARQSLMAFSFPFLSLSIPHSHSHFLLPCSIVNDAGCYGSFFCVAKSKTMRKPSSQHCQQLAYTQKITSKWLFSSFLRHRWRHFVYINILCVLCSWKLCNAFQCHSDYGNGYMIDCYVYVSPLLLLLLLWTSVWPSKFAF